MTPQAIEILYAIAGLCALGVVIFGVAILVRAAAQAVNRRRRELNERPHFSCISCGRPTRGYLRCVFCRARRALGGKR